MTPDPFAPIPRNKPPNKKRPGPPRRGPARDAAYLKWIRSLPCVVCFNHPHLIALLAGHSRRTEAAHVGRRGIGQKCSDRETIPLCAYHHRLGPDSHHRLGKAFWETHGLDRGKLTQKLQEEFANQ